MQNRKTFKYRQPTGPSKILAILREISSILTIHARGLPTHRTSLIRNVRNLFKKVRQFLRNSLTNSRTMRTVYFEEFVTKVRQ